jgi:hypothetical protein
MLETILESLDVLIDSWERCPPELPWYTISIVTPRDLCAYVRAYFDSDRLRDFFCRRLSTSDFRDAMSNPGKDYSKIRDMLRVHSAFQTKFQNVLG